jgi:hypothetical protein
MKRILILKLIIWMCLMSCNGQTVHKKLIKNNTLNLKFKNTSVTFESVNSINDNIKDDFNIKKEGIKIIIEPIFRK